MATYTVTSLLDDNGAGLTLREALAAAEANGAGADEIVFDASLLGSTIRLTAGVLQINSGVVSINGDMDGDGNPDIIITGDLTGDGKSVDDTGILSIASGAVVSLTSLQLSGGYGRGADGTGSNAFGAISNEGTLSITDSIISQNYARAGDGTVDNGPFGYANGGRGGDAAAGILNNGTLTVTETAFSNNVSIAGDGGRGKTVRFTSLPFDGGNGGDAGTIVNSSSTSLDNVGFLYNSVTSGSGGNGGGGSVLYYISYEGGNGGNGGKASAGVVNSGTLSGDAGHFGAFLNNGVGGSGGAGSPNGNNGASGTVAATFVNAGGTSAGFTDLGYAPFDGVSQGGNTITTFLDDDTIISLTGNDTISTGYGFDTIHAGAGNDTITGGYGTDTVFGGSGNDTIIVTNNQFFDNVHGGSGVDTLDHSGANGHSGVDSFDFQAGTLTFASTPQGMLATSGIEIFKDNDNSNIITTSALGMTIFGNGGDDQVTGLGGNDTIDGGDGDDTVEGGLGNDTLVGGNNTAAGDTVSFANFVAVSGTLGITFNLGNTGQQNTGAGLDTISGFENVTGSAFDDTLTSNATFGTNDIINGGGGNDTLKMASGNSRGDHFNGGAGNDTLDADLFWTGGAVFNMNTGIVKLTGGYYSNLTIATFEQIENITVGGFGNVIGDGSNNIITATNAFGGGINSLSGGLGNDTIEGGLGADILDGGGNTAAGDTLVYTRSTAGVTVDLENNTASGGEATGDTISGFENVNGSNHIDALTGSTGNNTIRGGGNNDLINGLAGIDNLLGGNGDDTINGGNDGDTLRGEGGIDTLNGDGAIDNIFGGSGNDIINGGTGNDILEGQGNNDTIHGNEDDDTIRGADGIDTLFGDAGDDQLFGGNGADTLDGGTGNDTMSGGGLDGVRDTFVFKDGYDLDRINGFDQAGTDRLQLNSDLWFGTHGTLTAAQVVTTFGSINGSNTLITLDFGGGDILEVQNGAGLNLATLSSDILII